MDGTGDRMEELQRRLERLEQQVLALQEMVGAPGQSLQAAPAAAVSGSASALDAARPEESDAARQGVAPGAGRLISLAGRTLVVLGGAYLLRALTDAGTLPRVGGTVLGLVYAVAWLGLAYGLDAMGRRLVAPFYGVATALIAFPILWEATVSFHLLSPPAAALAMAGVTSLAASLPKVEEHQPRPVTVAGLQGKAPHDRNRRR